jgi:hypothetical protein
MILPSWRYSQQSVRAPAINLAPPGGHGAFVLRRFIRALPGFNHVGKHGARIAHNGRSTLDILVDGGWINIDMDLLRPGEKASSRPVMRSSKRAPILNHDIAIMHRQIGFISAVHAQHAKELRIIGIGPSPISVEVTGAPVSLGQFAQQLDGFRPGIDDAAAGIEDGPLGRANMSTAARMAADRPSPAV